MTGPRWAPRRFPSRARATFTTRSRRALTVPEIEGIVEKVANAGERAKKAGFEGVDINAASSHLFHNFLSPFWNKREDIYGGSPENRSRFLCQAIQEMKRRNGKDFAVSVIINGIEIGMAIGIDNRQCLTREESLAIGALVEKAGADMVQVRSHWIGRHLGGFLPDTLYYPDAQVPVETIPKELDTSRKGVATNILNAAAMKKRLSIPVAVVSRPATSVRSSSGKAWSTSSP